MIIKQYIKIILILKQDELICAYTHIYKNNNIYII